MYAGLVDMALECNVVEKSGSWFKLPDNTKVQGMSKVTDWFSENPEMILDELEDILSKTGYSTVNKDYVKEASDLSEEDNEDE